MTEEDLIKLAELSIATLSAEIDCVIVWWWGWSNYFFGMPDTARFLFFLFFCSRLAVV